ncbi:YbaK/EbsC family protein [Desulfovibrio psychrotolerans]|uniref:Cys-tRNA(Pro)/cys-tRNA(Cys) deacylase n=1 Tax=Desulfovibrio psychrotolerans TaxID=415242 RepID=A0A7J0BZJ3_9BACT|nr:YbaK/EbsC family protein [Desulfovibrio psychrotolerans]GFM38561.1 cys-tRNA(pro)/cys-tRNA(cys) deacylase [Desulfovibrio psychrotolerans]
MCTELKKSAQKVQQVLDSFGLALQVKEFSASTRTSQEAADAIGCQVGQIAKSLVFRGKESGRPILVIASGANRVDEKAVRAHIGEKPDKADAAFVLEHTGYAIGGIPPVGHAGEMVTVVDEDLLQYDEIWAAAGTPNAVFRLTPQMLLEMTKGTVLAVRK